MEAIAQTNSYKSQINFKYLILFILTTATIVSYIYYFQTKQSIEHVFEINDANELTEVIYNSGVTDALKELPLEAEIIKKMAAEIQAILDRTTNLPNCELYFLLAKVPSEYPVLGYGDVVIDYIYLNTNEPWKVGITTVGEINRYYNGVYYNSPKNGILLTNIDLTYVSKFRGTQKEMLILEKILIYTYPIWSGHTKYLKPPGCKIYR